MGVVTEPVLALSLLSLLLLAVLPSGCHGQKPGALTVKATDQPLSLSVSFQSSKTRDVAFSLTQTRFRLLVGKGRWLDSSDGSLVLSSFSFNEAAGHARFNWTAKGTSSPLWVTEAFFRPGGSQFVTFRQIFPSGLSQTGSGTPTDIVAAFPSWDVPAAAGARPEEIHNGDGRPLRASSSVLHWLTFYKTFAYPMTGVWDRKFVGNMPSGPQGGAPLILFDRDLHTVVLSPLDNFMVSVQSGQSAGVAGTNFACGLQGKVTEVPAGFSQATVLSAGSNAGGGVRDALISWGDILLARSGKARSSGSSDTIIENLGYWTDNGAFYYYTTEPNSTYAKTIVDAVAYETQTEKLPVRNVQLDSWWYYKREGKDGLIDWVSMPSVFPEGMTRVYQAIGKLPLTLHNRWFAVDNVYSRELSFPFTTEPDANCALPKTQALYDFIMSQAQSWGMEVSCLCPCALVMFMVAYPVSFGGVRTRLACDYLHADGVNAEQHQNCA
jgi:hypothetical protein